jgi:cyclopropane fatty-acyl-phospholipid synthase-like methyltransferase
MKWLRKLFFTYWYFREPPWDTNISPPELIGFLQQHPAGRAIDMGCGTGTNVITLAKYGWQAIGIEYVRKAVRTAKRKAQQANVRAEFQVGDVTNVNWVNKPFDLVLDIGCLHSLTPKSRKTYIQNLPKLLVPGGTFLLYSFIQHTDSNLAGLRESELEMILNHLDLVDRQDGQDGDRPSGWFTYQKSSKIQEGQ